MEGAIESGERAATEVIREFSLAGRMPGPDPTREEPSTASIPERAARK
jgi:hypothetical protein